MGGFVLGFAFGLLDVALGLGLLGKLDDVIGSETYLSRGVTSHGSHGALGKTSSLVQVGLAG